MSLTAPWGSRQELHDELDRKPVLGTSVTYRGMIFDVRRDTVDLGDGGVVDREYVDHPGAVIVVALRTVDGVDRLVMIRQYRHAAHGYLWELPAGLLDVPGEDPQLAAARELAEEVDLRAGRWDVLIDHFASPGSYPEAVRIFLARDLSDVPGEDAHVRQAEEGDLTVRWVSLDDAYAAVLAGQLHNPGAVIGVMAAWGARQQGWATLRPADAPWPWHPAYR